MNNSSYQTVNCEVLEGQNKLGYVVELRFTEIQDKETARKFFKLCESFYKTYTEEMKDGE